MTSLYYSHNKDHKKTTDNELEAEAEAEKGKQGEGALIRSSASGERLNQRRRHGAPLHGVVVGERDELRTSRPCPLPGTEERGAVSPLVGPSLVDADGGVVVFASRSSRRRCSSYVVSSMLARLPAAGMGCLVSPPSCPIYSLACWVLGSSEAITKRCLVRSRARRGRLAAT